MGKISAVLALCLALLLAATVAEATQPCPAPGSGSDGVAEFAEACTDCDTQDPVPTCNGEFTIQLVDIDRDHILKLVTYTYEVYKPLPGPEDIERPDLSHWVLGLDLEKFQHCLGKKKTLSDLFVACSVYTLDEGMDCGLVLPDPSTQLDGLKFEGVVGDGETIPFSLTLDETALGCTIVIADDCVVAATKAGDQDIQRGDRPVPGYACVLGPVCVKEQVEFICPRSQGFWKNHPEAWPVDSLMLGAETYTREEAIAIMKTPTRGDASIILARQLIAAKLNIENGSNPARVCGTIEAADDLLATYSGKLPYGVRTYTPDGQKMVKYARILDAYNNGYLTPKCVEY